jgi:hypothetical protein
VQKTLINNLYACLYKFVPRALALKLLLLFLLAGGVSRGLSAQSILSALPDTSQRGQTFAMTITGTGTNFTSATGAMIRINSVPNWSTSWNATSNTLATANFTIPSNVAGGNCNIEMFGVNTFFNGHHVRIPAIQSLSHDTVQKGQSFTLTVNGYGTDFTSGTGISLNLNGPPIFGTGYSASGPNQASANISIPANSPGGNFDVWVQGQVMGQNLGYIRPSSITSISQNSAGLTQSVNIIITGNNSYWTNGVTAMLSGPGGLINSTSVTVNSTTNMVANFSIPANPIYIGQHTLSTTTGEIVSGFTVLPGGGGTNYGRIEGKVYDDQNVNCIFDGSDGGLAGKVVTILPGPYYASTNAMGDYGVWVPLGTYSVSTTVLPPDSFLCPLSGSISGVNVATPGAVYSGNDFALDGPTFSDYYIHFCPPPIRPGFTRTIPMFINNYGQTTASNVQVRFKLPSFVNYISSSPPGATLSGDTVTWNLGSVQNITPSITFVAPANTQIGTPYTLEGWVFPSNTDVNMANNYQTLSQVVIGSYDPNDKQAFRPDGSNADGFIEPTDSILRYMIRFQNTGTDTAFNVYVRDTLDPLLDISSLRMLQSTHNYIFNISPDGEVEWTFANILLPDSGANQMGSNGMLFYEIAVRPSATVGDTISNRCGIYFDFNLPVITNTVHSILCPGYSVNWNSILLSPTEVSFTDQTSAAISWLWDFGDGNTSTSQNPTHIYADSGNYTVCLYTQNACGRPDSLCQTISTLLGIDDPDFGGMDLYPSPNTGEFVVKLVLLGTAEVSYELFNTLGTKVAEKQMEAGAGTHTERFDIRDQSAGIYYMRVVVNGKQYYQKVLKR